jgi:serine/threonine protein kinase
MVTRCREIDNMLHVDHPNVLKLMEIFEDDKWFYMVMEYMQGGELFEKIVQRGRYSERDAAQIFKQIVSGVQYLHDKGIAHRYAIITHTRTRTPYAHTHTHGRLSHTARTH